MIIRFLERIFRPLFRGIFRRLTKPFRKGRTAAQKITKKIQAWFRQMLFMKEISIEHYVKLGRFYIAKKLIALSILISVIFIYFLFINPPVIINNFFNRTSEIVASSKAAETFSGRAKYFDEEDGQLLYEGNMVDGQYSGNGKLFDENRIIRYEGMFQENNKHGQGKEYDFNGLLVYDGSFGNGRRHGFGSLFRPDGSLEYEGDFSNGLREGAGKSYHTNGEVKYIGEYKNNEKFGQGELFSTNGTLLYRGEFVNGAYGENGTEFFTDGETIRYVGDYLAGKRNGNGRLNYFNGEIRYEGMFQNNQFTGEGALYFRNGQIQYKGNFRRGVYSGEGTLFSREGIKLYEGEFSNGLFNGFGTQYNDDEGILYVGSFRNGMFMNIGSLYDNNEEEIYHGYFRDGYIDVEQFLGKNLARIVSIYGDPDFLIQNDSNSLLQMETLVLASLSDNNNKNIFESDTIDGPSASDDDVTVSGPSTAIFNQQQLAFNVEPSSVFEKDTFITEVTIWNRSLLTSLLTEAEERYENKESSSFRRYNISGELYFDRSPFIIRFKMNGEQPIKATVYHECECQFDIQSIIDENNKDNSDQIRK